MIQLAQTVAEYRPHLHSMALRLLGNHADAEDAVQDALVLACKNFHQFRGAAKLSTWLTAIVLNSAKMQLRTRREHIPVDELSDVLAAKTETPEAQVLLMQIEREVDGALGRLSPVLFRAFDLRYVQGLTIREVAALLDVPQGTVKARASRARALLSRRLRKAGV